MTEERQQKQIIVLGAGAYLFTRTLGDLKESSLTSVKIQVSLG